MAFDDRWLDMLDDMRPRVVMSKCPICGTSTYCYSMTEPACRLEWCGYCDPDDYPEACERLMRHSEEYHERRLDEMIESIRRGRAKGDR